MVAWLSRRTLPNLMRQHSGRQASGRGWLLAAVLAAFLLAFLCQQWWAGTLPWLDDKPVSAATADIATEVPPPLPQLGPQHVVYLADLHGDLKHAQATLRTLGITDEAGQWTGGKTVLVQGGDMVDRGPQSLPLIQYFLNLTISAAAAGGSVVSLLGNHELMLLQSDTRYFSADEFLQLGGGRHSKPHINDIRRKDGEKALLKALQPNGWAGQLLRSRPLAYVSRGMGPACDLLFIHAGAFPWMVDTARRMQPAAAAAVAAQSNTGTAAPVTGLLTGSAAAGSVAAAMTAESAASSRTEAIPIHEIWNQAVAAELHKCNGTTCGRSGSFASKLLGAEGGVWSRYYTTMSDTQVCEAAAYVTSALHVSRIIVGHTIQEGGKPSVLCGGQIVMADIGMSMAYGGSIGRYAAVQCGPVKRVDETGNYGEMEVAVSIQQGQGADVQPSILVLDPPTHTRR